MQHPLIMSITFKAKRSSSVTSIMAQEWFFLLVFFNLVVLSQTASIQQLNKTITDGKVFITGDHNEIIFTNNLMKESVPSAIHEKLDFLRERDEALSKKVKELEGRILTLGEIQGKLSLMNKTVVELNKKIEALDQKNSKPVDYSLLFTRKGATDYVITGGMPSLAALTACCWTKSTDKTSKGTPISYAVTGQTNEFILYNYNSLYVYVNGEGRSTSISVTDGEWHHVCATWENTAGSWKLYKDGTVVALGQGLKTGHVIRGGGALVLGNEQNGSVGGGLNAQYSFIGELTGVNIWDHVLSSQSVARMSTSCLTGEGNVFKWSDFKPHIKGGVQIIAPSCKK